MTYVGIIRDTGRSTYGTRHPDAWTTRLLAVARRNRATCLLFGCSDEHDGGEPGPLRRSPPLPDWLRSAGAQQQRVPVGRGNSAVYPA
jgi:hypothetical protein